MNHYKFLGYRCLKPNCLLIKHIYGVNVLKLMAYEILAISAKLANVERHILKVLLVIYRQKVKSSRRTDHMKVNRGKLI